MTEGYTAHCATPLHSTPLDFRRFPVVRAGQAGLGWSRCIARSTLDRFRFLCDAPSFGWAGWLAGCRPRNGEQRLTPLRQAPGRLPRPLWASTHRHPPGPTPGEAGTPGTAPFRPIVRHYWARLAIVRRDVRRDVRAAPRGCLRPAATRFSTVTLSPVPRPRVAASVLLLKNMCEKITRF